MWVLGTQDSKGILPVTCDIISQYRAIFPRKCHFACLRDIEHIMVRILHPCSDGGASPQMEASDRAEQFRTHLLTYPEKWGLWDLL